MDNVIQELDRIGQLAARLKKMFLEAQGTGQSQNGKLALATAGKRIMSGRQELERLESTLAQYVTPPDKPARRRQGGPKETK